MKGWAVSSALIGCVVGALSVGSPGDLYGRRTLLMVLAVFFLLPATGTAAAGSLALFLASRFIGGLAIGGVSVLLPMYIPEIAPPASRGRLAVTFQLAIVIGILVSFFVRLSADRYRAE